MASKSYNCINPICKSVKDLREPRMAEATQMVCNHFGVMYEQSKKVCVRCLRICLVHTKYHENLQAKEGIIDLFNNYTSHSVIKLEEDNITISTPENILEHNKNINIDTKTVKENNNIFKPNVYYNRKLNDIADNSINKVKVVEELCSYDVLKFSPLTVTQNKLKMRVHLSKSRQSYYKKPSLENKTKKSNVTEKSTHKEAYSNKIEDTPLGNIKKPMKIENILLKTQILQSSKIIPSFKTYFDHNCDHSCAELTGYDQDKTNKINVLAIPLHFGFNRHTTKSIRKPITYYETPCGVFIQNIREMMHYLTKTGSEMTIDQFDFNSSVNPLAQFNVSRPIRFLDDLSKGLEFRPITCVNSINDELPAKMNYMISRQATAGVNINVETNFLCGCDCTDNCEDKSKCACWQSTINGQSNIPDLEKNANAGYKYRRLYENVLTGIYECNKTCKCHSSCLNRVVQQPMTHNLQLFKTEKKGWGVRCLNDIPRGTFICCYIGNILTETNATEEGKKNGDEYLADLDFIEVVEKCKEDYEENAFSSQKNFKHKKLSKKTMNLSNKLTTKKSSNGHIQTMFKDENLAVNNTFPMQSRNLKHKNFSSNRHYYKPRKSVRYYYGKGDGVYTINAKCSGNIGRYFNHSCTPNLFVQNVFVDTHDLRFPWVSFFSEHYIPAGTELTWDYSYEVGSIPGKVMTCYCDSAKCKRRLL